MQGGLSPALLAVLGKYEGLFGRLMITSHCIRAAGRNLPAPEPFVSLETAKQAWAWIRWILWPHAVNFYLTTLGGSSGSDVTLKSFAAFILARDIKQIKPSELQQQWSTYKRGCKTMAARREFWDSVLMSGWARITPGRERAGNVAAEYTINPRVFDGRFREAQGVAIHAAKRYRENMHPDFIAQQTRQPGED